MRTIGRTRLRCSGPVCLARSAGALRSLEQRVETFRSAEQGRRFRSLLRRARVHELHGASPSDVRLHRRARACVGGRSKGGQEGQALGRSRGDFTTKIHAKADASGDIIAFDLTGGEAFDGRHFETLLDIGPDIQPRAVICDKGYASKVNRDAARARGIAPVIPHKANEKNKPAFFARTLYKARARIEQGIGRLKRFKRVAMRCEKTAQNFRSIVSFATPMLEQIRPRPNCDPVCTRLSVPFASLFERGAPRRPKPDNTRRQRKTLGGRA